MKKSLLTLALAVGALAANAQSTFQVSYNGEPIADGSTITCNEYNYQPEESGKDEAGEWYYPPCVTFNCDLKIEGTTDEPVSTISWWEDVDMASTTYPTQMCYAEYDKDGKPGLGSCVSYMGRLEGATLDVQAKGDGWKVWQLHISYDGEINSENVSRQNISQFRIMNVENPDDVISFKIIFTTAGAGVDGIAAEDAAPEYFNLQGVRVAEPQNGIYIVRRGSKVTKEVVRR